MCDIKLYGYYYRTALSARSAMFKTVYRYTYGRAADVKMSFNGGNVYLYETYMRPPTSVSSTVLNGVFRSSARPFVSHGSCGVVYCTWPHLDIRDQAQVQLISDISIRPYYILYVYYIFLEILFVENCVHFTRSDVAGMFRSAFGHTCPRVDALISSRSVRRFVIFVSSYEPNTFPARILQRVRVRLLWVHFSAIWSASIHYTGTIL